MCSYLDNDNGAFRAWLRQCSLTLLDSAYRPTAQRGIPIAAAIANPFRLTLDLSSSFNTARAASSH